MVFVDTSALYALLDRDDRHHAEAERAWRALLAPDSGLVTHSYVLVESTALVQRRLGPQAVRGLHTDLPRPIATVWVDQRLHELAVAALLGSERRDVSLVDRVSFELMRQAGIEKAFAFDPGVAHEGFDLVPPVA